MSFFKKSFAVLALVAVSIFAAGCASIPGAGGADTAISGDLLTERKVIRALYNEPNLTGDPISVTCVDGVITLNGTVDSQIEKELAERVAAGIEGVTQVNNGLTTNPGGNS